MSKRLKVSEEEEGLILRLRNERRIYNEGIQKVIEWLMEKTNNSTHVELTKAVAEILLLKKEV